MDNITVIIAVIIVIILLILFHYNGILVPLVFAIGIGVIAYNHTQCIKRQAQRIGGAQYHKHSLHDFHGEKMTENEIAAVKKVCDPKTSKLLTKTSEVPDNIPYRLKAYPRRVALHIGQRKLLMTEVDFITDFAKPGDTIVYAGSASGIHIPFLAGLFEDKNIKFDLWDPRDFDLTRRQGVSEAVMARVKVYQDFFTNDTAKDYAKHGDKILFICDIRTGTEGDDMPTEETVEQDMEMQRQWVEIMNPRAFMLKFRLNYMPDDKPNTPFPYLEGEARIQAFAPQSSSETRLIAERKGPKFNIVPWNQKQYDNQLYYTNSIMREWGSFDHGIPFDKVPGLDTCYDCALEAYMWKKYLGPRYTPEAVADLFNKASKASRKLTELPHGFEPKVPLVEKRSQISHHGRLRGLYKPPEEAAI